MWKIKICTKCKKEKSLSAFVKDKRVRSGYGPWCKLCKNQSSKLYRENNPVERVQEKKRNIKSKYGITLEQWQQMFEKQQGCCAICGKHQLDLNITLGVDHNYTTGKVRGLLCNRCNIAVGFCEDIELNIKVSKYVNEHNFIQKSEVS